MPIDWFTIAAQVVNFLVLVWLLKRFLYQPILNAIDAREQRIAKELAEAELKSAAAQQEREAYRLKNEELDRQRDTLLRQAQEAADTERLRLLDSARQEADYLSSRQQQALRTEQASLGETLSRRTREEVFAIARKTLADLAGASLEERMTAAFIRRLRGLETAESAALQSAFKSNASPLLLRSAYPLPAPQRQEISLALKEIIGAETAIEFGTAAELLGGMELSGNGYKISWSIDGYLASLDKRVDELLKPGTGMAAGTAGND